VSFWLHYMYMQFFELYRPFTGAWSYLELYRAKSIPASQSLVIVVPIYAAAWRASSCSDVRILDLRILGTPGTVMQDQIPNSQILCSRCARMLRNQASVIMHHWHICSSLAYSAPKAQPGRTKFQIPKFFVVIVLVCAETRQVSSCIMGFLNFHVSGNQEHQLAPPCKGSVHCS